MTESKNPTMCFKMGKYFIDGSGYKDAMKEIAKKLCREDELIDLVFLFFNDNYIEELGKSPEEVCNIIDHMCEKGDSLPSDIKNYLIYDYETVIKPEIENDDRVEIFEMEEEFTDLACGRC